jgi:poly(3-hydroxybutyrate) depolymerase
VSPVSLYAQESAQRDGKITNTELVPSGHSQIEKSRIDEALSIAGENRGELEKVLAQVSAEHRHSAEFLVANMPPRDLKSLKADFLLEEIRIAHESLEASPWKDQIPQDIFLNNILPYVNINERRDAWRKDFREKFLPLISEAKTPGQAAALLNQRLFPLVNVKYSTKRAKADQSPYESMQSGLASCTGLSVLLIDACRALAIPARFVGTPLWSDNSGNHSWIEVWDQGWHFTGAAEPSGDKLDQAWFIGRASTAQRDDRRHAIYAVSFQKTPLKFPMVWDPSIDYISAVNVTDRYTNLGFKVPEGTQMVSIRAVDAGKRSRVVAKAKVFDANGEVASGTTRDESFDANDHLHYYLKEGQTYRVVIENQGRSFERLFVVGSNPDLITWEFDSEDGSAVGTTSDASTKDAGNTLEKEMRKSEATNDDSQVDEESGEKSGSGSIRDLQAYLKLPAESRGEIAEQAFAKVALSREDALAAEELLVEEYRQRMRAERDKEVQAKMLENGDLKMPYFYKVFGEKPQAGRALFISMHGGGGAPAAVNDGQYENQKRLYQPKEGVYLAPRAPTNTWNLWHEGHIDGFFDRLIADMILFEDVDSDRVYLMGYSAGGDGVYQLAPRMADRFAAASMMAGHPNETSPLSLRNLPFTIHMGEKDGAYNRNKIAESWKGLLGDLRQKDESGYEHFVKIHAGKGHWMDRQDAEALDWMTQYTRNRYPAKIVWKQDDIVGKRFYWLGAEGQVPDRSLSIVERENQDIRITESDLQEMTIYLNDSFIDCDKEVRIQWGQTQVHVGVPQRTIATLSQTLQERGDPKGLFSCKLQVMRPAVGQ